MKTTFDRISAMTVEQRDKLAEQFEKASRVAGAEPIAVVGIGCRLPGGITGPDSFWKLLESGTDAVTEVPADRWDAEAFYDPDLSAPGRMPTKWGAYLDDVTGFDADFFGITPREATSMDPQQRVALEVAWEALENAGYAPDQLGESRTAVMLGVYYSEYQNASPDNADAIDAYSATGNAHSVTVGRIAYLLGLKGPAVAVDTACSSSLVSIHLACQSLRMRESDLALAGGVNLNLRPETQLALAKWGMLSPHGHCYAFDSRADGFVRGEGAGVVVLKRLTDAVRDGDRVLAVVRGSAVNQDGRSNGLTAPNAPSQRDVLTRALKSADVAASTVDYIECHGTGTALGDPIEFDALAAIYGKGEVPCALGTVKTNMGHLEAAAGVAGFIKTVLTLQHGTIAPNLHFDKWNPQIDPKPTRLFVPTEAKQWPTSDHPRRAAVSSFGFSGTNAHIVLEQGPESPAATPAPETGVTTLVVSGKTPARLAASAKALADWLEGDGAAVPLTDVAFTVNHHRSRYQTIATVCARTHAEAVTGLRALAAGQSAPGVIGAHDAKVGKGTVFLYSGQGAQWAGMGKALLAEEPAFAKAVDELEPAFLDKVGFSLRQTLEAGEPVVGIDRIQPVLVGMQLALTELWRSYGVEPDAVIGHSMGETTAAVVAGVLTPAEGLDVIATRTRLMKRLSGQGAMALLELDPAAAEKLIADRPDVTIAVYASPKQVVIAGPPDQVDELVAQVDAQGKLARRVEVDVASHHPTIDPVLPELREALTTLSPAAPKIPLVSTVAYTGSQPMYSADYWAANLRNPVRFSQAVHEASAENSNFIEISPHPLLSHAISDTLAAQSTSRRFHVGSTVNRDHPETLAFHAQLAAVRPPAVKAADGEFGRVVDAPTSAWQHVPFWQSDRGSGQQFTGAHPLLGLHVELPSGSGHVWQSDVGTEPHPWLADHIVHGLPVMPGAGFAEIALAAAQEALGLPATGVEVSVEVEQMLPLDPHTKLTTQLHTADDGTLRVEIHSRSDAGGWTRHAIGTVRAVDAGPGSDTEAAPAKVTPTAGGTPVSPADFYTALRRTGAHHGHAFAALTRIARSTDAADTEIELPDEATPHRGIALHPVMLDAALQGLAAAMSDSTLADSGEDTYLPVAFGSIRVFGTVGRRARCRAELVSVVAETGDAVGRVTLTDDTGTVLARVDNVTLKRVQRRTVPLPLSQKIFDSRWVESAATAAGSPTGSWLALADGPAGLAAAQDFAARFGGATRRVVTADLGDEAAVREAFATATADPDLPPAGVIVFGDFGSGDAADAAAGLAHARDVIWGVAGTVRAIVGSWHGKAPRLWLVTRGGLVVAAEDGPGNPAANSLKGLVRVLAYEHPDLKTTLLDTGADDPAGALAAEIEADGADDVIAWRGGARFVERLSRAALPATPGQLTVRRDGSYVVTGALGGVGMSVVTWLVDHGAGRLVLNGRRGPSDEVQAVLDELSQRAEIAVVTGDIADPGVADRLVAAAEETGKPLRGVIHSAAVLEDEIFVGLTRESLDTIWAPKATGALRLHEATVGKDLDWWVGFSSIVSLLGSPGQAAYAAANAWVDGLVAARQAAGLPAIAINWGQWADVGLASTLRFSVLDPISPAEGVDALGGVLAAGLSRVGIARLRLDRAAAAFPEIHQIGFFTDLIGELQTDDIDDDWGGADALKTMDAGEVNRVVVARLRRRISAIMGYSDDSAVDVAQPLTELGLDSLMAVRMRNTIRGDFGVEPPVALLLQGATLTDLAVDLIRQLGLEEQEDAERPNALRERAQQRAAARQRAASRRKVGPRS
ncbi:polyketide synthase [Mycolicibacterium chubuense]|uniref:Phthiocerol/phenolphthiocerol synthesis polyketide synthase type I PpsB n=1 Tax=Mycolicibacterium chubuense TaxID=1800 RepID=A0A0J6WM64_MYCCU|nr:type I polyketide synthase [Mycolicibacterium chubuense]KMO83138.1 Phthiocerol/phenolphthiocerol synthesis polyketide synthase type I PpsB [Mycolicibacterium chubuense]ORA46069.1 polyketide synthase [Mycolicibacterium chubuense]SPX96018.1 polyketide synthase family protein [Mycolicibacterium chubuense]